MPYFLRSHRHRLRTDECLREHRGNEWWSRIGRRPRRRSGGRTHRRPGRRCRGWTHRWTGRRRCRRSGRRFQHAHFHRFCEFDELDQFDDFNRLYHIGIRHFNCVLQRCKFDCCIGKLFDGFHTRHIKRYVLRFIACFRRTILPELRFFREFQRKVEFEFCAIFGRVELFQRLRLPSKQRLPPRLPRVPDERADGMCAILRRALR